MTKTAVVIPNWNGLDFIEACLRSLQKQTIKLDIIVVDNGSTDGSKELIKKNFPKVILLEQLSNLGFAGGVNVGIQHALNGGSKYILLFNNDAEAAPEWAEKLVAEADNNSKAGIITGKFMRMDKKRLDSTGDFYSIYGLPFPRGRNEIDEGQYDTKTDVFGASGGASLYRSSMLREIGLFDEDFFAYFEDVDISFRAQLAGWSVKYVPRAVAYHHVSGTSSQLGDFARYHSAKNFLLLYAKNMPSKLYIKYLPYFTLQLIRMAISSMIRGKFIVFIKGSFAAVRLHRKTVKKRRNIQRARKVQTEHIDSILFRHRPPKPPVLEEVV